MQMLTQRLSLLSEFAPPDFYARSTFGSYIDTLQGAGLIHEADDGTLHLDPQAVRWERYVERLLPADAVLAIRRVAVDHAAVESTGESASGAG
jgi:glycerol-3-phosphate O-acyltransferase